MLTKLTKEQENGILEWREKCLKIGRDTSPINKELTEKSWKKFYKILGKKEPIFWYCQSPLQAQIIINIFPEIEKIIKKEKGINIWNNIGNNIKSNIGNNIGNNIWNNIESNIWNNIESNIWNNIGNNIGNNIKSNIESNIWNNIESNIGNNIWSNIGNNIGNNIESNIGNNIGNNIESNIGNNIKSNIGNNIGNNIWSNIGNNIGNNIWNNIVSLEMGFISTYSYCQHDVAWVAYYKFYKEYGLLPNDSNFEIFDIWFDLAKSCGWCYTFENIVFVCEKPSELNFNINNQLHKNGNMSLKYSDGYGLYTLNGVNVPKYLAITPENELSTDFYNKEKNADVKAEFVRKFGIDRMKNLGKVVDSYKNYSDNEWYNKSEYELIDMSNIFSSIKYAPFLSMKNLSVDGISHLEGVSPDCKTIEQALEFRCGGKFNIKQIS